MNGIAILPDGTRRRFSGLNVRVGDLIEVEQRKVYRVQSLTHRFEYRDVVLRVEDVGSEQKKKEVPGEQSGAPLSGMRSSKRKSRGRQAESADGKRKGGKESHVRESKVPPRLPDSREGD